MDEQGEVELQLQSLDLSSALQTVLFLPPIKAYPHHLELRPFLLLACLAAQLVEQLLLILELLLSFGFFLSFDLLYFWVLLGPDSLDLYVGALVFHVDLDDVCI